MMQINVAQLLKSEVGVTRQHTVDDVITVEGGTYPVKGEVTLTNIGKKILVQGKLIAKADLNCGRCLRPYQSNLPLKVEAEFYPSVDVVTGFKLAEPEDDEAFKIDAQHTLDLSEAIRQYILLALPMKPLCREDCAGICPTCGKDLNQGKCECPPAVIDSRWAELLKLKKNIRVTEKGARGKKGSK
ncbi:MAG: DUF177 domain-containing protein [Dehalococcoidales bacterium]|nr:DUF177 domain-containing protein [Dehalococcoidales bacterium]